LTPGGVALVPATSYGLAVAAANLGAEPGQRVLVLGRDYPSNYYVAEQHRNGHPLEENWISRLGSQDFAGPVDYQDRYQPGARRFDVGQRTHFETTPMAVAALRQLLDWGVPRVAATLGQLTNRIQQQVQAQGLALTSRNRGPHMLGIRLPAQARQRVAAALADAGVFAGLRGASLRVPPHL
jgi:selenocysteine lyase/cysteine desulfurase